MTRLSGKSQAQRGHVLITILVFMLTLSALWIIALTMSGSELSFVGGRKVASQKFYDAEAGTAYAIDKLPQNIPAGPLETASKNVTVKDANNNTIAGMTVTVRPIHSAATNAPQQEHEIHPPEGSGSGVNTAVARRYAITSEAGGKIVQVGVYRVVAR